MLSHDKKVILNDKSNPKTQTVTLKTTKIILKVILKAILKTTKVILKQPKKPKISLEKSNPTSDQKILDSKTTRHCKFQ